MGGKGASSGISDKGKIYGTEYSTFYDNNGKRTKQIDLQKAHKGIKPHTHHGYEHNENDSEKGASKLSTEERKMVDRINKIWYNNRSKK